MPTIPVYVKDKVYWVLASEASKFDVGIGKFCSMILENYAEFVKKKEEEKEWQGNTV